MIIRIDSNKMKSLKLYKELKADLKRWSIVHQIITLSTLIYSLFLTITSAMQYVFLGTPIMVGMSIAAHDYTHENHNNLEMSPGAHSEIDGIVPLAYGIYSIEMMHGIICLVISIIAFCV